MAFSLSRKEKKLGVSHRKRRYDLPLHQSGGTGFIVLLIGLMSFLAVLAMASAFALSAMTDRWSSGLENRATIEIPANTADNKIRSKAEIADITSRLSASLKKHSTVESVKVMSEQEIAELVRPWLGDNLVLDKVPLPGLVSLTLHNSDEDTIKALRGKIKIIAPAAQLDTHESWLADLLRFTGALKFSATLLIIVIAVTTVTAIAGAVRSRLAVHGKEVELLHLMGATDNYISSQFQRHSLRLALKGSLTGLIVGGLALVIIGWLFGKMDVNLLPNFSLSNGQMMSFTLLPLIMAVIAIITARQTVLRVLRTIL